MHERIKKVRALSGLTQTKFAEKVGIKQNTVAQLESGLRNPSTQLILSIAREFGISRHWLETGEGDMIDPQIESDIELLTRAMEGQSEAKKKFLRIVAGMPDDLLEAVLAHLEKTLDTKNTP